MAESPLSPWDLKKWKGEESNAKKRRDFDDQPKTVGEAQKKIEKDFGRKYSQTDCALIISLLALYKKYNKMHSINNLFDIPFYSENIPDDCVYLKPENQIKKTSVYTMA